MDDDIHPGKGDYLQQKAQLIANALRTLNAQERAWVLLQAGLIGQPSHEANELSSPAQTFDAADVKDLSEDEQIIACLQLIRIFGHLSKSGQDTLMELAVEMDTTERFERLIDSGDFEE